MHTNTNTVYLSETVLRHPTRTVHTNTNTFVFVSICVKGSAGAPNQDCAHTVSAQEAGQSILGQDAEDTLGYWSGYYWVLLGAREEPIENCWRASTVPGQDAEDTLWYCWVLLGTGEPVLCLTLEHCI